jgi:hypothetical protein
MKIMNLLLLIMAVTLVNGCVNNSALIRTSSTSIRNDIFQELSNGGPVPAGYADVRITLSLKTHKPGIYSARDIHGTPEYRLLINVDGQAVLLHGSLQKENSEPRGLRDSEAGEGIRYQFNKKLRLNAGTHKVVIAFPADDLAVEREIYLPEGSNNSLVLEPVYGATPGMQRPGFIGATSFEKGIKGFWVVLNGKSM